jgi:2'-5' RNA ligase
LTENITDQVRSFIAADLPQETKSKLAYIQEGLKQACSYCPAKWVSTENIHLTMNFLGSVPSTKLYGIKSAIARVCEGFDKFDLALAGLGAFPNLDSPHVIWVGLTGDIEPLFRLQKRVEQALAKLGFTVENRPFSPHLTLARVRDEASSVDRKRLGEAVGSPIGQTDCFIPVRHVSLIKSQLTPTGPIYTILSSAALR